MHVETIEVAVGGIFSTFMMNCYLLSAGTDANAVLIVDPGDNAQRILTAVGERTISAIVLTHYHYDHVGALAGLRNIWEAQGIPIYLHPLDQDRFLREQSKRSKESEFASALEVVLRPIDDGACLELGGLVLKVMHTPGHSAGSICLYHQGSNILISGDTLFRGTTGRTDLGGGSPHQMHETLQVLALLPDATMVYPGHEQPTTIAYERTRALIEY